MNVASCVMLFLLMIGILSPIGYAMRLVFIFASFSAMAVIPPSWAGGTSLTPGSLAVLLLIVCAFRSSFMMRETISLLLRSRYLSLLGLFWIVAAFGALFLPILFDGEISVYGMRTLRLQSVALTIANFTQTSYLLLSVLTTAVVATFLRHRPVFQETLLKAILWGGGAVIATGFVEIVANFVGAGSFLLDMFHTADYGYSTDEINGARRVLGLTPEPASFGGLAVSFCALLVFLRPAYLTQAHKKAAFVIGWGCGVMAFLSISSTAFAAMFVLLALYAVYSIDDVSKAGKILHKTIIGKATIGMALIVLVMLVMVISQDVFTYIINMIDTMIFQKKDTSSYLERTSWTMAGLDAFVESFGLGVGAGSVRTSNFFANIIASTGVIGAGLFSAFLARLFRAKAGSGEARDEVMVIGAKFALGPMFAALFLAGTVPDFGVMVAVTFGLIAGLAMRRQDAKKDAVDQKKEPLFKGLV